MESCYKVNNVVDKPTNYLGWFLAFMIVSNSTTLLPFSWGTGYYAIMLFTMTFLLLRGRVKVRLFMICLYLAAAASIALNDVPAFFKPWGRLGTFIMLTLVVSPAIAGKYAETFKVRLFASSVWLLFLCTVFSIFTLFLGTGRGFLTPWFQGIMCHSMIMGPVSVLCMLFCLYQLQSTNYKKRARYIFIAILIGAFLCLLQAGSRAALIGGIASFAAFLYFRYKSSLSRVFSRFFIVIFLLFLSFPLWFSYAEKIIEKNQGNTSTLDTSSRAGHWEQRINEWSSSPVYGIGFATVDAEAENSNYNASTGGIETGSSWLSVLSMTGTLGGICIFIIFLTALVKCWKLLHKFPALGAFLISLMIFFIFHMMAEGYIFAGGNFLNTLLWLIIGTIYSVSQHLQYATELDRELQLAR